MTTATAFAAASAAASTGGSEGGGRWRRETSPDRRAGGPAPESVAVGAGSVPAAAGSRVRLRAPSGGLVVYELVEAQDADPRRRRLSTRSAVGSALLGRRAGDVVAVETPGGTRRFEVLSVS